MSESKCPACGDTFRKGRRALLLLPTGELEPRICCKSCAVDVAVRIVPVSKGAAVPPEWSSTRHGSDVEGCGASRAELLALRRKLKSFVTFAELEPRKALGPMCTEGEKQARCAGLEQAAALVDCLLEGRPL